MAQGLIQTQAQQQAQLQKLSPQQLLQVKLLELPVNELEQRINIEMDDNPALEIKGMADDDNDVLKEHSDNDDFEDYANSVEQEERQSALNEALENMGKDDEMPVYNGGSSEHGDFNEIVFGEYTSFYDELKEQVGEHELSDKQRNIIEYLIGSLDDDGLIRKNISDISDELAFNYNIDASEKEIENMLIVLQSFDPAGIGARSLQECLLLQIERKADSKAKELMNKVISKYFEEFTKNRWDKIKQHLNTTDLQTKALATELKKLNPKPGNSLSETLGRSMQQITPDFIVDSSEDGSISFCLNDGNVPELHVSQSFADSMEEFQTNKQNMSRQMKEALLYTKKKIDAAQTFIEAINQRKQTLYTTMKSIIQMQHKFFEDGDEGSLKPMILKDIADRTGMDISTISRVSNSKYVQTRWGTYPLKFFFNDSYTTENGDELSTRQIKLALQEIVNNEDKNNPMSDDVLKDKLKEKGFPIARRTVSKYREQLGIPIARLRK
ncbi:RNA polymerase factor sigma-54 [Xylanibacter oryzae]|uniref:RNA polymerase factor sigma-54 n=1 Tax=Xylanibacter oryzae TaxID=185293 RepID=UPI0004B52DFB|nr:RNA polymerase factor sigma-54 [Xylanibacter oryzae]MBP7358568.1 RNA polymerase factor sigma-54 [Prevotella sp.]